MALFKGSVFGLGTLAILVVLWRIVVGAFVIGVVLLKIVVFIVLPIILMLWVANRLLRNGARDETTV